MVEGSKVARFGGKPGRQADVADVAKDARWGKRGQSYREKGTGKEAKKKV